MIIRNHAEHTIRSLEIAHKQASRLRLPENASAQHEVAWAFLRLTFDHAASIASNLYHHGPSLAGSPLALLRPMIEAMRSGAWFSLCATEKDAEAFMKDGKLPSAKKIATKLEATPHFEEHQIFTRFFEGQWTRFHDFTHGGHVIVKHYMSGHGVGANLSETDANELLCGVEQVALFVVQVLMVNLSDSHDPIGLTT